MDGCDREEIDRRVVESLDKRQEVITLDDGFQYFWIENRGALTAHNLRAIADELDRRNSAWKEQVERELREGDA